MNHLKALLLEGWADDIAATRYMAEEPVFMNEDGGQRAPTPFEVWRKRNLPTLLVAASRIKWFVLDRICAMTDHKWVDDSYGGPESGCMAGHCERCGYSFHERLY